MYNVDYLIVICVYYMIRKVWKDFSFNSLVGVVAGFATIITAIFTYFPNLWPKFKSFTVVVFNYIFLVRQRSLIGSLE